jgi:hypothetical protein
MTGGAVKSPVACEADRRPHGAHVCASFRIIFSQ